MSDSHELSTSADGDPNTDPNIAIASALIDAARGFVLDPPDRTAPVVQFASPDEITAAFADVAPIELGPKVQPQDSETMKRIAELVIDFSVHTTHPRFFNQNFAGPDPIAVAGDWLATALNTTSATFEAAPTFTLMESAVLRKLAAVAGWPDYPTSGLAPGLFAPGGSTATLYALQLARHRQQPDLVREGSSAHNRVLFVSDTGHYAAVKSAALLGLGMDAVIKVATNDAGAMLPSALNAAIDAAVADGATPFCVIGTAGTTVTSAFDPLDKLADICEARGLWLHVDGAWGGSALFSPSQRHRLAGIERADSFVWNLHKMMGMTQQCSALLVKDPGQLGPCFATGADYIFQPDKLFAEEDSGDRHFQCARRVDVLKLWLAWNAHGDAGFAERIDHAVALADYTRTSIADSDGAFVEVGGEFTNVVFVWVPPEMRPFSLATMTPTDRDRLHALAPMMKARLQQRGSAMLGFQPVHDVNTFRLLFMNPSVRFGDVNFTLAELAEVGADAWSEFAS